MQKTSYRDYETHNVRTMITNRQTTTNTAPATIFKPTNRVNGIRTIIEFLCHWFHNSSPENAVERALSLYRRNMDIYETRYAAKKEIWAAACYSVDAEMRKSKLTFIEIAAAFRLGGETYPEVEPKKICKIASCIKKHETDYKPEAEYTGNLTAVSRLASGFGMNFRQEKIARKIVVFIDERELILGLNPLSILSVSFFLTICLSSKPVHFLDDTVGFVKRTLSKVSNKIHIAQNTIRKGIREVLPEVLRMVETERVRLKVNPRVVALIRNWEI